MPLVDKNSARRLGFEPRADVLLSEPSTGRRIWVEFEISRADPVANHAKFATTALLEGLAPTDCFVSMTSRHIVQGRAALAAGTTVWMRSLGIPAFQVELLPMFDEQSIRNLNSRTLSVSEDLKHIPVKSEINKIIEVCSAADLASGHRIHKADNPYTVGINVRQWNSEMRSPHSRLLWGRRRVQYFVFDPASESFAPSKFCAFVPGPNFSRRQEGEVLQGSLQLGMSMDVYVELGEQDPRFDGHVARTHLESRLGYLSLSIQNCDPLVVRLFEKWRLSVEEVLIFNREPVLLLR